MKAIPKIEKSEISLYENSKFKKVYELKEGKAPSFHSKETPFNPHALAISKAILFLLQEEGKEEATKEEIMNIADKMGIYEIKPSKQSLSSLFTYWYGHLKGYGFIS